MKYFIHYVLPFKIVALLTLSAMDLGSGTGNGFDFIMINLCALALIGYIIYYVRRIQQMETIQYKGQWIVSFSFFLIPTMIYYWVKIGTPFETKRNKE
jgi:hypothetical protein